MPRRRGEMNVFLTGAEGIGWALDEDFELTARAVAMLGPSVRSVGLEDADVIHSISPLGIPALSRQAMAGRRIICHLENDLQHWLQQPEFISIRERVDLWIAQNRTTFRLASDLGWPVRFVPYAVDVDIFRPQSPAASELDSLRRSWSIPDGRFLIGNFMRDTLGADLRTPKPQKGADVFLAIVGRLHQQALPVHVVLAGPRRHWLRSQLRAHNVPFTYVGNPTDVDDLHINILDKTTLNRLYHLLSLYLVTSRWEGGSRVVLESAITRCRILSTRVGLSPDVLDPTCLFSAIDEAVEHAAREARSPYLHGTLDAHAARVESGYTVDAVAERLGAVYRDVSALPPRPASDSMVAIPSEPPKPSRRFVHRVARRLGLTAAQPGRSMRISLWHEFHEPPYGGGNQFMRALGAAMQRLGAHVETNSTDTRIDVHVWNSAWFDVKRFVKRLGAARPLVVHRIDGPIALYRGAGRERDDEVFDLNARFASATVLQSAWCYRQLNERGYRPVRPAIVHNAADPEIFHARERRAFDRGGRIRLIATSWSDNPRKGASIYKWLDDHLDWSRFEFTFVGRIAERFQRVRHVPARPSRELSDLLRAHDIYVTASQHDPCSNALIEAMACGLPALYYDDGGHPELVRYGGLPFRSEDELLAQLDRLVNGYELFQGAILVPSIDDVARRYLNVAQQALSLRNCAPGEERVAGASLMRS